MKTPRLAIPAVAIPLLGVALWSCNKDNAQQAPATGPAPQEQAPAPTTPAPASGMMQQSDAPCPMVVQGANVTVTDTDNGVALAFTTQDGDVDDLRQRVQHMARMYEMHRGHGTMMWHHMGGGMGQGGPAMGGMGPMPAANAKVTDIDKGARVELTPTDSSQLDALRQHVRWHQQRMQSGECWMLQNQPPESQK